MREHFQLYFEKTYIIVVPTYKETLVHHHNMLHVFFGKGDLRQPAVAVNLSGVVVVYNKYIGNGVDLHSCQPSIQDAAKISTADVLKEALK